MYSPEIKEEFVQRMYQLKLKTGKKITEQANEAIKEWLDREERKK
jgi:hypothetical protein